MQVRRAVEKDSVALFKLAVAMHGETDFRGLMFDPEKTIASVFATIAGSGLLIVAQEDEQVVGMLRADVLDTAFSSDLVVAEELFYVAPEHRGGRAAFMLLREFMRWAEDMGAKQVRAGVATGTGEGAERLYEHFGMRRVGGNYSMFLGK